ncbi:MAG: hypothetical protein WC005_08160 [Candidatus Nanopelagicales bacterium]
MNVKRLATVIAVLSMSIVPLAACSSTSTLNVDSPELTKSIETATGASMTVTCPADIPIQQGLVSECTANDGTKDYSLMLTQDDDQGHVSWKMPDYIVPAQ